MGGFLVTDQGQAQLAAVIACVLQSPDHVQGNDQSALAVMGAGTVDTAALQTPGTAGKGAHGVDGVHMAQQQHGGAGAHPGPGGEAGARTLRAEEGSVHAQSAAEGVQMAGQPVYGLGVGAGGLQADDGLPQAQHFTAAAIQIA